jgi:uncharacterized protein (DUF2267 family)
MEELYSHVEEKEMQFLFSIKKELSLEGHKQAAQLVACVLHALRQTLTLEQCTNLLLKLPDYLKLIFVSNWKRDEQRVKVEHLDEFVNLIMDRERNGKLPFFKNEVQALSVAVLTLKNLFKLADLQDFEGLSNALKQELREIPAEAAA